MWWLIRLIIAILLIPFLYALGYEAYVLVTSHADFSSLQWFVYGFLAFVVVWLFAASSLTFWRIFEHEFIHTIMAVLFFNKPTKFAVDAKKGGLAGYENGNNFVITLAPYFLPLLTIPLLVIKPFAPPVTHEVLDVLIGFTYAFHVIGLLIEFRLHQPDIKKAGWVFSTVMVLILNLLFFALIICIVLNDLPYFLTYLMNSLSRTVETFKSINEWLKGLELPDIDQLPF